MSEKKVFRAKVYVLYDTLNNVIEVYEGHAAFREYKDAVATLDYALRKTLGSWGPPGPRHAAVKATVIKEATITVEL